MASVLDLIKHYQVDIEIHSNNEEKVLRCINKLFQLNVTVQHLQDTGVGRTVNALRKEPGEVGQAARALVLKWKTMVAAEESDQEGEHRNDKAIQNGYGSGRYSDDHSSSRHSHDDNSSKNSTPKSNNQEPKSNHQEHREMNGNHSSSKRKYHSSEDEDHDTKKKSRHTSSSEDDHKKVVVKQEKLSESESSDDSESSDSDSESYSSESSREEVKVKTEVKNEIKKEIKKDIKKEIKKEKESPDRQKSSSHSSKHHSKHDDRKKETSSSKESSSSKRHDSSEKDRHSHHKSSKDISKHTDVSKSSSHKHKSSHEKESSSEKRHKTDTSSDENKESKSSKHSSDKHKSSSSSHKQSSLDKHSSSDKLSSSDKHRSSDKSSSKEKSSHSEKSEKHKSSSEKDSKHKSRESSSSKEKHSSSSKDKSKERTSSLKEKSNHSSEKKQSSSESKSQSDKSIHKDDNTSEKKLKERSSSSSSHKSKSSSSSKSKEQVPKKKSKLSGEESGEDGIDCGSGASFAEALGMMVSPSKPKKKSFKDVNSPNNTFSNDYSPSALLAPTAKLAPLPHIEISALPEISPNYKPRPPPKALPHFSDEDAISAGISSKNQRTKVYSGNKVIGKVTTLYEMCVHVLQEHIDALEFTGGVPYDILKPVIDRATPQQLFTLEHYNPYLMDDTDHLWQKVCEKSFRNKRRQEMETWREMYLRCQEEQEIKLRSLTANIKLTQEAKKAPIKQTKMAYVDSVVKPPRNIARKQALHGTAYASSGSPAGRVASLSSTPGILKGGRVAPPPTASVSASSFKPKKAPLMQKALQFMRGRKR